MSIVPTGAAEVANIFAQHRASHNAPVRSLQVVGAAEFFRLPIVEAKAAVLHFLPIHVGGKEAGYDVEQDGA